MEPTERLALSWGNALAVYKTAAVAAEPHRQNGGLPRIRTVFSPVKSRDFTVKVCNPEATAKAELNRRSQACEVLTGTGVRVAKRIPSALNPAPGHYFDRAGSLPQAGFTWENGRASG